MGLLLIIANCCEKENIELIHAEGYIIGYNPCAIQNHLRIGYVIVSSDLKDTLVTYSLSDDIYKMPASVVFNTDTFYRIPASYFQNYSYSSRLPESTRYEFKIRFTYGFATSKEIIDYYCPSDIMVFEFYKQPQIIIKSAVKY